MSLTKFINNKEVRKMFRDNTFKPLTGKILKGDILAPPQSKRYMLIGTAFDYLMRFYIEYNNNIKSDDWIARRSIQSCSMFDPDEFEKISNNLTPNDLKINEFNDKFVLYNNDDQVYQCIVSLMYSDISYQTYIKTGKPTDDLFISCILLAKLDGIVRGGYIDEELGIIYKEDIKDMKNLYNTIPNNIFNNLFNIQLNPTFGKGSILVGGADADLIINDELIDIKTTKKLAISRDFFNQIFGYYILNRINGNNNINKIGIYFSRYGIKYTYDIYDIASEDEIQKFIKIFSEKAHGIYKIKTKFENYKPNFKNKECENEKIPIKLNYKPKENPIFGHFGF